MRSLLLLCVFVTAVSAASAAGSGDDGGRGPLACSTDFCPIYCGNVQPILPLPNDGDTQVLPPRSCANHGAFAPSPLTARPPSARARCSLDAARRSYTRSPKQPPPSKQNPLNMPSSFREDMLLFVAHGAAAMGLRSGLVRDAAVSLAAASFDPLRMSVSHSTDVASAGLRAPLLFRQVKYSGNGSFYTYGGNCSMGQLLPRGLKMSERNGQNLRQAYGNFIPVSYLADPSKVFLQSDNSDRVIASGNAVFRAIFTDDLSRSYSSDSLPVVDWFVPDKSPMNPGDFCNEELDVRPAFALACCATSLS
jgi:hypothetical protein